MKDVQLAPWPVPLQLITCLAWLLSIKCFNCNTRTHTQQATSFAYGQWVSSALRKSHPWERKTFHRLFFILYKFKFFYLNSNLVLKRLIAVDSTVLPTSLSLHHSLSLSRSFHVTLSQQFYDCLAYRCFSGAYLQPFLSLCPNYPSRFLSPLQYFCFCFVFSFFSVALLFCFSFFFSFNSAGIQWNLQRQRKELQIDFTQFFFRRFHMQRICFYDFAAFPFRLPLPPLSAFSKAIKLQCACHQKCTRYAPPTANSAPPSAASVRQGNVIVSGAHCHRHRHRHSRVVPCFACHFDSFCCCCCCCWIACNMPVGVVVLVVVIKVGTL